MIVETNKSWLIFYCFAQIVDIKSILSLSIFFIVFLTIQLKVSQILKYGRTIFDTEKVEKKRMVFC